MACSACPVRIARLFLYRDRLQFEVRPAQQRPRAHKLARWKILGRKIASVNRIERIEERQVRARNLHIHQVVHGHARLRQHRFLSVQQILNLILDFLRRLSSFRIQSEPPRQVQRIPRKDSVAERKLRAQLPQLDSLSRCLRRSFRKRSVHCKNSRHRQSHHQKSCATIHVSLHSNVLSAAPRECSTQSAVRQAARTAISSPCKFCASRYRVSFESKGNQPDSNKVKRSQAHRHPEQHALQQWPPSHFFQSPARDSRSDQKKCCGEPEAAECEKCFCGGMLRWQVGVRESGENEKQNEPRKLNLRAVAFYGGGDQRQRNDPEGPGEFNSGADY